MDSPLPTPMPSPSAAAAGPIGPALSSAHRSTQLALASILVVMVGLLAFRGYGARLGTRPTEAIVAGRLDLNRAGRAELEQVPSIGPKLAEAIDDHRQKKGPFRSVDDLRDIRGVGPALLDKVRPYLRVEGDLISTTNALSADSDPAIPARKRPTTTNLAFTPPVSPSSASRSPGAGKLQPGDPPINVNTAAVDELQRLPGIGPVTARNIASARVERPFRTLADLDRVKGIGPKGLEKLRPFVVVE